MKYNTGDKVVRVGYFDYISNPYHDKIGKGECFATVKKANEKNFTISNWDKLSDFYKSNSVFNQDNGKSYSYPHPAQWLHAEKDRDFIIQLLNKAAQDALTESEKECKEEIKRLDQQILMLKTRRKDLKKNGKKSCNGHGYVIDRVEHNVNVVLDYLK